MIRSANPNALIPEGLEKAVIGLAWRGRSGPVAVVSIPKAVKILQKRDKMTSDDAEKFLRFNAISATVPNGPVWAETD
jgi:hypothetical protein